MKVTIQLDYITTSWTFLSTIKYPPDSSEYQEACKYLFEKYKNAIVKFFICLGAYENETDDMASDFFVYWIKGGLKKADRDKGRFRSYLKTCLKNFYKTKKRQEAEKNYISLTGKESKSFDDLEKFFDYQFVITIFNNALKMLKKFEQENEGNLYYTFFSYYYLEPIKENKKIPGYSELQEKFGKNYKYIDNQLTRAREKLKSFLYEEIRKVVTDEENLEDELNIYADIFRHFLKEL